MLLKLGVTTDIFGELGIRLAGRCPDGGGGLGGPSAAVAHVGGAPEYGTSTIAFGAGGLGGPGGNGDAQSNHGADGSSGELAAF